MRAPHLGSALGVLAILGASLGCGDAPAQDPASSPAAEPATAAEVGYDLRRLRPVNDEPLAEKFERMRTRALAEGKTVAVLFSADWCEPCRRLELELGNMHPPGDIGHVRIFEIKEEDWESVTRMNEVNTLRHRWDRSENDYPLLVVLDEEGRAVEEMKQAIERLEALGVEPTLPRWFRGLAPAS